MDVLLEEFAIILKNSIRLYSVIGGIISKMIDLLKQDAVKCISTSLQDDISMEIFCNRIMFGITGEFGYLRNIIKTTDEGRIFIEKLAETKGQPKVIFGAGQWGQWIYKYFPNENWVAFADNNPNENYNGELKVVSVQEMLSDFDDVYVFIASRYHWKEIFHQLLKEGIDECKLFPLGELIDRCASKIYFDEAFLQHNNQEVFVDAGAFDGKTILDFNQWCNGKYSKIYAFEPQIEALEKCQCNCAGLQNISYLHKGLWDSEQTVHFVCEGTESRIVENRNDSSFSVNVTSLDINVLGGGIIPTFIKMDIEGAELKALEGAAECISKYSPQLAISVYHKPEDIIEIPMFIKSLNPKYRFWLRHYSLSWFDTVLYAVP